jgi:guanylate kinase
MSNEGQPGGRVADQARNEERVRDADRGALIVVSAPSGAGKSTLVQHALERDPRLRFSVSYTTRRPRGSERDGVEYYFVSEEQFAAMRERGEFLESAQVHGFLYGTRKELIERTLDDGYDAILDIDVQGAAQIRRNMPRAVTVFVLPPSKQALQTRLESRNLNEAWDIERRIRNATQEVRLYQEFDYVIVNDELERATAALQAVIIAQRHRPGRQESAAQAIIDTFGGEPIHA